MIRDLEEYRAESVAAHRPVLSPKQWGELHDYLTLALDALGDSPEDFTPDFLHNAVLHQRLAIKITHKAVGMGGVA